MVAALPVCLGLIMMINPNENVCLCVGSKIFKNFAWSRIYSFNFPCLIIHNFGQSHFIALHIILCQGQMNIVMNNVSFLP